MLASVGQNKDKNFTTVEFIEGIIFEQKGKTLKISFSRKRTARMGPGTRRRPARSFGSRGCPLRRQHVLDVSLGHDAGDLGEGGGRGVVLGLLLGQRRAREALALHRALDGELRLLQREALLRLARLQQVLLHRLEDGLRALPLLAILVQLKRQTLRASMGRGALLWKWGCSDWPRSAWAGSAEARARRRSALGRRRAPTAGRPCASSWRPTAAAACSCRRPLGHRGSLWAGRRSRPGATACAWLPAACPA